LFAATGFSLRASLVSPVVALRAVVGLSIVLSVVSSDERGRSGGERDPAGQYDGRHATSGRL